MIIENKILKDKKVHKHKKIFVRKAIVFMLAIALILGSSFFAGLSNLIFAKEERKNQVEQKDAEYAIYVDTSMVVKTE